MSDPTERMADNEHSDQMALRIAYEVIGRRLNEHEAQAVISEFLNEGVVFRMAQWFIENRLNGQSGPASDRDRVTLSRARAEKLISYARLRRRICYDPQPSGPHFFEWNDQALAVMETMTDEDVAALAAGSEQKP